MNRRCSRCKAEKAIEDFSIGRRFLGGRQPWCKECVRSYQRGRLRDPEYSKSRYCTVRGRSERLLQNARTSSKRLGVPFCLTREWVEERVAAGICSVTGIPFELRLNDGKTKTLPFSPSIDRVDPRGPYSPENCRVVVWIYNRARGDFDDADLQRMVEALAAPRFMRKVIA